MKKTLSMLLLVLFVVGLFVSCNADAISNLFKEKIQEYTVTFDLQGHGSAIDPKTNIASGSTISAPPAPTADGFTFAGWYKEETLTNVWDFDNDTVTNDITLYAKWTQNPPAPKTIADILPSEFPTDFDSSNWKNGTNKVYISNQNLEFSQPGGQQYEISTDKTVSLNGNAYTITDGNDTLSATLKFTMNGDELQSIEINFSGTTASSKETLKGTYSVPKTFKAVYAANTLTFYYDAVDYSGEGITVYEGKTGNKYLFNEEKPNNQIWGYYNIAQSVKEVVIDESVKYYAGLTSTTYMFFNMREAGSITGAEYLDVSKVTNMKGMFGSYGYNSTTLNEVPDVSNWNTEKVTTMEQMFESYGYSSKALDAVPDVINWNTENVENIGSMFQNYGYNSKDLSKVPNVSNWEWDKNNPKLIRISGVFQKYGYSSQALSEVPDVSNWNTTNVEYMQQLFANYGHNSSGLNFELDLSKWIVTNVTNCGSMFSDVGYISNWSVTIPATTEEEKPNESGIWYVGDGTSVTNIEPAAGKSFTLAGN